MNRVLLLFALLKHALQTNGGIPESKHFNIQPLAPGVYAAINKDEGHAICNSGIIDLGDETLVFDCFISPAAARDLRQVAESLTGNPVRYLVNSHYHNDHVRGNQCFKGARILATQTTHDLIAQKDPEEQATEKASMDKRIEIFEAKLKSATDAHQQKEYRLVLEYFKAIQESFGEYVMTLPDSIIGDSTWIEGSQRKVLLLSKGAGHTADDLVMWIPREKILFASDLVFIGFHPWLGDGSVQAWINTLETLRGMKPEIVVPGHGRVGAARDIDTMMSYLQQAIELVDKAVREGRKAEEIEVTPIPDRFRSWWLSHFFAPNLMGLYEARMRKE